MPGHIRPGRAHNAEAPCPLPGAQQQRGAAQQGGAQGAFLQAQAAPLYEILFSANPASVGGKAPDEGYYLK